MTTYYSDTFDSDTVGALPTGWANSPVVGGSAFKVGTINAVSPTRSFGDTAPANLNAAFLTLGTPRADMDVVFTFKVVNSGGNFNFHTPILRSNGLDTSDYRVAMTTTVLGWYQRTGGGYSSIATTTPPALVSGVRYYVRARVQGTALKVRFWRYGVVEPSTWNLEASDGAVTAAGGAGIHVASGGTNPNAAVDDFLVESPNDTPIPAATRVGPCVEPPLEWLKADAITGRSAGDNVPYTDLVDQSGNGSNPTAGNGGTYRANVIGSQPGIEMDGTADNYTCASVVPAGGHYTKVWVGVVTNTGAVSYLRGGGPAGTGAHSLYLNSSAYPRMYQNGDALVSAVALTQSVGAVVIGTVADVTCSLEEDASFNLVVNGLWGGISGYDKRLKVNTGSANYIGAQDSTIGSRFKWCEQFTYSAPLGGGEINEMNAYLATKYGLTLPTIDRSLILDGDSLTIGAITTAGSGWPEVLSNALTSTYTLRFAAAGRKLTEMVTDGAANIDPRFSTMVAKNVLVIWGGKNDNTSGVAAATTYANLVTYCQARKAAALAAGVTLRIVVVKETPSGSDANVETRRLAYNSAIDGNALADWHATYYLAALHDPGSQNNATNYNADLLHFTDTGAALFAAGLKIVIEALSFPATSGSAGSRSRPTPGLNSGPFTHFPNRTMANAMHNVGGMPIEGG